MSSGGEPVDDRGILCCFILHNVVVYKSTILQLSDNVDAISNIADIRN